VVDQDRARAAGFFDGLLRREMEITDLVSPEVLDVYVEGYRRGQEAGQERLGAPPADNHSPKEEP
jgi:hypothetical protein